jgi:hypothetical protein
MQDEPGDGALLVAHEIHLRVDHPQEQPRVRDTIVAYVCRPEILLSES